MLLSHDSPTDYTGSALVGMLLFHESPTEYTGGAPVGTTAMWQARQSIGEGLLSGCTDFK